MVEPPIKDVATLVAQAVKQLGPFLAVRDDHAPLAGGHLLVWIEGKHGCIAEGPGSSPLVFGANGFACIFVDGQVVLAGVG